MAPPVAFAVVVTAFTLACTALVSIVYGLARLGKWKLALLSLVVPVGVWLAYREGLKVRAALLALASSGYLLARAVLG